MENKKSTLWREIVDSTKRQGPLAWISLAVSILALIKALWF